MRERRSTHRLSGLAAGFLLLLAAGCSALADPPGISASAQGDTAAEPPADLRCVTSGVFDDVRAVIVDDEGATTLALGGDSPSAAEFPDMPQVVRVDRRGSVRWRWRPQADDPFDVLFSDMALGANGEAFVTGLHHPNLPDRRAFLVALDPEGHARPLPGFAERRKVWSLRPLRSGGFAYLAEDERESFLVRIDASGREMWRRAFPESEVVPRDLAVDAAGDVILGGDLAGTFDFGGGPITPERAAAKDVFLVSYDAAGKHRWSRHFGGTGGLSIGHLATDAAGNIVVIGRNYGTMNLGGRPITGPGMFLASFDREAKLRWSWAPAKSSSDLQVQTNYELAVDGSGAITVGSNFFRSIEIEGRRIESAGSFDILLLRFDAAGHLRSTQRFGGPDHESLANLATSPRGVTVLLGDLSAPFDLGCGMLPRPTRKRSRFVAVLAPADGGR